MKKYLFAAAMLLALGFSGAASAKPVSSGDIALNIGSTPGLYDISSTYAPSGYSVNNSYLGTLAAKTSVTFTFTVNTDGLNNNNKGVSGGGDYSFYEDTHGHVTPNWTAGYSSYSGGTNAYMNPDQSGSSWGGYNNANHNNDWYTLHLMTSLAKLAPDGKSGSVTISNYSDSTVNYWAKFVGTFFSTISGETITYKVSAVPLPAALPLFGGALLLLGAARKRKKA